MTLTCFKCGATLVEAERERNSGTGGTHVVLRCPRCRCVRGVK
jgi:phage FluMu protein Com